MFDKKALFEYDDTVIEKVDVPEWGELGKNLYIRTMSGKDRDTYEMSIVNAGKKDDEDDGKDEDVDDTFMYNMRASLVVACCCDKEGNLLFKPEDADKLGNKSGAALDRLFDVGRKLMKMSDGDVKEMEKSLESDQN